MNIFRSSLASLLVTVAFATGTQAADTQWWISDGVPDYAKAESRGVVVNPDGSLTLGPKVQLSTADSLDVIWAIALLPDGAIAIAGERGRIDRWTASGGIKPWVRLPAGQVLSLAVDGGRSDYSLLAGTGPDGVIYRITGARGDTSVVARTGERYVWALAKGAGSTWYAATGTRGRLMSIDKGATKVVID